MRVRVILWLALVSSAFVHSSPQSGWLGPTIESIDTKKGTSALDVVSQIRDAIKDSDGESVALRVEVSDADLKLDPVGMKLKEVPAMVALKYVADQCGYEFLFEKGMWVLRDSVIPERRLDDDWTTLQVFSCSTDEMNSLGLSSDAEGVVSVLKGKKWPEIGSAFYRDGVLVVKCFRWEADCFLSLRTLLKYGYKIPKINSEQVVLHKNDSPAGDS